MRERGVLGRPLVSGIARRGRDMAWAEPVGDDQPSTGGSVGSGVRGGDHALARRAGVRLVGCHERPFKIVERAIRDTLWIHGFHPGNAP